MRRDAEVVFFLECEGSRWLSRNIYIAVVVVVDRGVVEKVKNSVLQSWSFDGRSDVGISAVS